MTKTHDKVSFALDERRREQLTEHFTLREMTLSATAIRHGWTNEPDDLAIQNLILLCENVLEPLRRRFGVIRITSGFRTEQLNKAVGGVEFSQHRYGQAADIHVSNLAMAKRMFDFIRQNTDFDQCILEYVRKTGKLWLHVSYNAEGNRRHAFMNYEMSDSSVRTKR